MTDSNAYMALTELGSGARAVVRAVGGGKALAGRLAAMGLVVGSRLEVLQNPPHGPLLILVRDTRIALGRGEATKVLAEEVAGRTLGERRVCA
jgi:ferrous iron transport protein A